MTYPEALQYLRSLINYEREDSYDYKASFKLDRMRKLSALLGDPHRDINSIHVAGTKGKGSTAAIIHSILTKAGFRAGLYTSPHLVSFRERIRIGDRLISEADIVRLVETVRPAVEKMAGDAPSFFEVYTALAYLYFNEQKCDFAVYETGLGGRLDATNIIEPLVCVITPISYEHMQKLGNTLEEIAYEKSGIIKPGSVCVSAPQEGPALHVLETVCQERCARLLLIGKDITYTEIESNDERQIFSVSGMIAEYPRLETGLLGSHQVVNAAAAIGAVEALAARGICISPDAIAQGIRDARWEGRLEIAQRRPLVVLDGAQNRASSSALAAAIKKVFKYNNLILMLGVSKDKDICGILDELAPISNKIILTKSKIVERAMEPSVIKGYLEGAHSDVAVTSDVSEALELARSKAGVDDLILITGSLFVVGETKEAYGQTS